MLNTLPERMVKAGIIRDEGGKLNNADKLYLCRQRHRISKYNWSDAEKIERMRQLYVDEELPCIEGGEIGRTNDVTSGAELIEQYAKLLDAYYNKLKKC